MAVTKRMSPPVADRFGAWLGLIVFRIWPSRRKIATSNLQMALGHELTSEKIDVIARESFRNLGRTVVELSRFERTTSEDINRIVVRDGEAEIRRVYEEGRGAVLITAHFGNWELLGSMITALGYPFDALVGVQHNPFVDDLLTELRKGMGLGLIKADRYSGRRILNSLKAGRFVGMIVDQHASSMHTRMDFFGRPAAVSTGPATFAVRAGCPVFPLLMVRERFDRHLVDAGRPIYPAQEGTEEEKILAITREYTRFFEDGIRRHPDQWLWSHRRWKI